MPSIDATQLHGPEHVKAYLDTDGDTGHDWKNGTSTLILTTKGRKSGEERLNALIYGMAGDDPMVVAGELLKGSSAEHPEWYLQPAREPPPSRCRSGATSSTPPARDATPEERPGAVEADERATGPTTTTTSSAPTARSRS